MLWEKRQYYVQQVKSGCGQAKLFCLLFMNLGPALPGGCRDCDLLFPSDMFVTQISDLLDPCCHYHSYTD